MQYYMVLLYSIIIPPRKKMGWNMVEQPFSRGYRMISPFVLVVSTQRLCGACAPQVPEATMGQEFETHTV